MIIKVSLRINITKNADEINTSLKSYFVSNIKTLQLNKNTKAKLQKGHSGASSKYLLLFRNTIVNLYITVNNDFCHSPES